jgi:ABC-type uncharacterized transport system involved in gliding motility auxiliary subunit
MMRSKFKRYATVGLIIVLIAVLVSVGLYIVQREFNLALQISLAMIVVGLAIFVILDPERVRIALTGRQARYGSNAVVMGLAFLGIIVVINFLIFKNPKRWDLTESGIYTLAPETIDTIDSLTNNVTILGFYTPNYSTDQVEALLNQYKFHSDGKINYEFINPYEDPLTAEKYNVSRDGTLVLVSGEQQEQVNLANQRDITGALVRIISPGERKVYFLTGHGEYDPESFGDDSYSQVKTALESKNYSVEKLNLPAMNNVPEDAEVVIIAGPTKALSQKEIDLLDTYLMAGGSLLVMQEPVPLTDFGEELEPLTAYLSNHWGITLGNDMVVDLSSSQPLAPFANQYGDHIITEKMQGITTVYPTARSVSADSTITNARLLDLVLTSENSWAETDLDALTTQDQDGGEPSIEPDENVELMGPVALAATLEEIDTKTRIIVFGDSDFAADVNFFQYGNGDIFVNSVDWLTEQESIISLTPKEDIQRFLIPPGKYTMNLIFLGAVVVLPGLVLVAGVFSWLQRRRRG